MQLTYQAQNLNMIQHGLSVHKKYLELLGLTAFDKNHPSWLKDDLFRKFLIENQFSFYDVKRYQIFHDCGKPYVRQIDLNNKVHFPNHAEVSGNIWEQLGGKHSEIEMMKLDMQLHSKEFDLEKFSRSVYAPTLLLTSLAEIHANAEIFGGFASDSFKIKLKKIDQRGKQLRTIWIKT